MKTTFTPTWRRRAVLTLCSALLAVSLQAQSITLRLRLGTVQQAIEMLQKNYNYSVVVRTQDVDLNRRISIDVREQGIDAVIGEIFTGQEIGYTVNGKNIVISKKEAQSTAPVMVRGTVLDEDGAPVVGATIVSRETGRGIVTDAKGAFTIQVPADGTLEVAVLGYETRTIPVRNRTVIEVRLAEESNPLDEIVVVGYGTQRKSDLTGSVAQISMSTFDGQHSLSLADYVRGSIAGLNTARSASVRGQDSFEVRGTTSLGSSSPLIIVDGVILGGMFNDINPNDVETVSVLKDASSTAVYGASGAAGAILITTKQGKTEKPTIQFDVKTGISILLRKEETYNVEEFLAMRGDKLRTDRDDGVNWAKPEFYSNPYKLQETDLHTWLGYDGKGANWDPTAAWLERLKLRPTEIDNYYNYRGVNWLDEVLRTGIVQDYNMSVSGKSKNLNYYWSLGYLDNKGVLYNEQYQNIRSRINITNDITDFLQVGIRANLSSTNSDGQPADLEHAYDNSPLGTIRNADGTFVRYPNEDNMAKNPFDKTQYDVRDRNLNVMGTIFAKVKLPYGFQVESSFDNRWRFKQGYTYKPSWTIDGMRDLGVAERSEYKQYEWTIENLLRWNKTYGNHKIDFVALQSAYKWTDWSTTAGATSFTTSELLSYHNLGLGDIATSAATDRVETKTSYMGRVNYSFLDRYLLTLSFRRDGYSLFGQDNPWGNFPAAAVAWRLSEEPFMKQFNWLDNLKIRVSYGQNGNSSFDRYKSLASLSNDYYINDGQPVVTLYPSSMGNTLLQWEESTAFNVGLDIGVFNNRLNVTVDAYQSQTTNQLLDRKLPIITGFSQVAANLGRVDNKGLEVQIRSVNLKNRAFTWTSDLAFWFNRNKIVQLYGEMEPLYDDLGEIIGYKEADDPSNGWYNGHAIDEIYGYKVIGIWQEHEAAEAMVFGRVPGDYKTYAAPGTTSLSSADYLWQGFTKPRYRMSLRNSFAFFNNTLNVSFMVRSEWGHKKSNNELNVGSYADRISQIKYPYWTYENPSDTWGRLEAQRTGTLYRDASFVRIENFTVSYTLPSRWMNKILVQNARISFNVDNVHSFDNWLYWDPETKKPTPTTFTFGLNLTL